ncbi:MAG: V-type ATPase 116kDa subunit family protein [Anaerolineae bacterium]
MLLKMVRVQIIGTLTQLDATVAALQRLGVLHVEETTRAPALHSLSVDETLSRTREDLAFLAARLDALLGLLAVDERTRGAAWQPPAGSRQLADWLAAQLDAIAPPIQELAQARDALQAEAVSLPRYGATLRKLSPLTVELQELKGYDTAALLIDSRHAAVLDLMRIEVERITGGEHDMVVQPLDEHTIAAILIYPRARAEEVQAVLGNEAITQVRLPRELEGRTFREALAALNRRLAEIQAELAAIDARLAQLARDRGADLAAWRREVRNRLDALATQSRFGATDYTFVVVGWLPHRDFAQLRETLAREVGGQVVVDVMDTAPEEERLAPVAFDNPAVLKPFESMVRLMDIPAYGALDPTPLVAVFLPLFFGLMLGDIAYGALLLAIALILKRLVARGSMIGDIAQIWVYGALWAIFFGVLFGEFLGPLGTRVFGLRALWMPREGKYILALFVFAIGLGAVQVVLGMCLGVWEAWRARERRELLSKLGVLLALIGLMLLVGALAGYLPPSFFTPTLVAILVGMVLLIVPAGPLGLLLGPLELVERVGNVLSYLRIAAIGLSSLYLALVAMEMSSLAGSIVLGGIVAFLLHTLNLALSMLSPTIQSLRLQYVEFFGQFYHGGGHDYRPFHLD